MQRIEQGRREWAGWKKKKREKQKRTHDSGITPVKLRVGDYVLEKRKPKKQHKPVTKWLSRMLRPFEIVEKVQRGVRARLYTRGRYAPEHEAGVHHFHTLLSKALCS